MGTPKARIFDKITLSGNPVIEGARPIALGEIHFNILGTNGAIGATGYRGATLTPLLLRVRDASLTLRADRGAA